MSKPLIGLDVSSTSLKWVELSQGDSSKLVLERCVVEPLQDGWIVAGHIEQFDEVAAALGRLVKASGSATREVALAMPDSSVIMTKIVRPSDSGEAELLRQVEAEVARLSGRSVAEMNIDYTVQGLVQAHRQNEEVTILIAAASKEKVQDRLGLVESAGLKPVILDVEAEASMLAACRLISAKQEALTSPVVALFQVGTEGVSLHVNYQGEIVHAARKPLDGALLSKLVAQAIGKDGAVGESHQVKEESSGSLFDVEQTDLQALIRALADGLASDLDAFMSASAFRKIDAVLLAGGLSVLYGLQDAIKRRIFFECVVIDPFMNMQPGKALQGNALKIAGRAGMLTACGLALRRFHGSW
jgi:type IV pilus assembly protein PilM